MKKITIKGVSSRQLSESDMFLYPTDSLYGLGAIATRENAEKIDSIKQRSPGKSYSIIVPSFDRILKHFIVKSAIQQQRKDWQKSYGPITVLCKRKNPDFMSWISQNEYIGLRYIQHPFQEFVSSR
ncbi:MAG: Telomere recombination [Candidatus Parcubacteria bacterium]|jgi:tRNA A37 threonylcarbamoyladenosine synthetase subunit TsaC/SUA5/YrdC